MALTNQVMKPGRNGGSVVDCIEHTPDQFPAILEPTTATPRLEPTSLLHTRTLLH